MNKKGQLPLNLQMFADDKTEETKAVDTEVDAGETEETVEFNEAQQEKVNLLVAQAKSKAQKKYESEMQSKIDEAVQSALAKDKEYSKLSEDERQRQELEDEKAKFEADKAEFEFQKLTVEVSKDMLEKGLPAELAEFIVVEGDAEKSLERVNVFKEAFDKKVAEQVKVNLRQKEPGVSSGVGTETNYGEQLAKKSKVKQGKLF